MDYKAMIAKPKRWWNWVRRPRRTYKLWRFKKWMIGELEQAFNKEVDDWMIHEDNAILYGEGKGPQLKGIMPSLEEWDEWPDKDLQDMFPDIQTGHRAIYESKPLRMKPENRETGKCKYCSEIIEYIETPIDNIWSHVGTGLGYCDPNENFMTAKNWAWPEGVDEPGDIQLTINYLDPKDDDDVPT